MNSAPICLSPAPITRVNLPLSFHLSETSSCLTEPCLHTCPTIIATCQTDLISLIIDKIEFALTFSRLRIKSMVFLMESLLEKKNERV